MAERKGSRKGKGIAAIIKFAGEKGKKAAEKKFGVEAVKKAQATMSKRKPVSKSSSKNPKLPRIGEVTRKTRLEGPDDITPELTGKDLDFGYDPIAPKIKKQGSGFGQKGGATGSGGKGKRQKKRNKGFNPKLQQTITEKDLMKGPTAKAQDRLLKGGQRGREKISRKAGGKVMTGSQLVASLYD